VIDSNVRNQMKGPVAETVMPRNEAPQRLAFNRVQNM